MNICSNFDVWGPELSIRVAKIDIFAHSSVSFAIIVGLLSFFSTIDS